MMTNILAMTFWQHLMGFFFVAVCVLLILVVLLQKGRGGGLSGAFGGGGGHSAFGAKTGDVFTWITVGLTFAFIFAAVIGNYVFVPPTSKPVETKITAPDGAGTGAGAEDAGEPEAPAEGATDG